MFEIKAGSGVVATLASFNGSNGLWPEASLIRDAAGDLFGCTGPGAFGGESFEYAASTIFEIKAGSGVITTLVTLGSETVIGLVADGAGNLYGTASGAQNGDGSIFKVINSGFVTPTVATTALAMATAAPVTPITTVAAGSGTLALQGLFTGPPLAAPSHSSAPRAATRPPAFQAAAQPGVQRHRQRTGPRERRQRRRHRQFD